MHVHVCGINGVEVAEVHLEPNKSFFMLRLKSANQSDMEVMFDNTAALMMVADTITKALCDRAAGVKPLKVQEW